MNQTRFVRFTQRVASLTKEMNNSVFWQQTMFLYHFSQAHAWQQFHHVVEDSIVRLAERRQLLNLT